MAVIGWRYYSACLFAGAWQIDSVSTQLYFELDLYRSTFMMIPKTRPNRLMTDLADCAQKKLAGLQTLAATAAATAAARGAKGAGYLARPTDDVGHSDTSSSRRHVPGSIRI